MVILSAALPAMAELRIIPSLTVSERYDSNILFTASGQGSQDFVTTVSPALNVTIEGDPWRRACPGVWLFRRTRKIRVSTMLPFLEQPASI